MTNEMNAETKLIVLQEYVQAHIIDIIWGSLRRNFDSEIGQLWIGWNTGSLEVEFGITYERIIDLMTVITDLYVPFGLGSIQYDGETWKCGYGDKLYTTFSMNQMIEYVFDKIRTMLWKLCDEPDNRQGE